MSYSAVEDLLAPFRHAAIQYREMNIHQKVNLRSYLKWLIDESPNTKTIVSQNVVSGGRFLEVEKPKY